MVLCGVIYAALLILSFLRKRKMLPEWMRDKSLYRIMFLINTIALLLFVNDFQNQDTSMNRNSIGGSSKTQEYHVSVDGKLEDESLVVELGALEYTDQEMKEILHSY